MPADTIVAVSTPAGRGGIGVVRIAGPAAAAIATRLTARALTPRVAQYSSFRDADGVEIDAGIALFYPAPASYTGEDVIELQAHANPYVLGQLVAACCHAGARPAAAGEFTERAYRNGKLDLAQAEAVADLIASDSDRAARAAARTLSGAFADAVNPIIESLHFARADLEAAIDFADEVMAADLYAKQTTTIKDLTAAIDDLSARAARGARLSHGANVAIIGAPNVGKSSLLNLLTASDRAIVSDRPGTTRDIVGADITVNGIPITLLDTAGMHATDDTIEQEGIRRATQALMRADLILFVRASSNVVDTTTRWRELAAPKPDGVTEIVVQNKIDLFSRPATVTTHEAVTHVWLSARHGDGIELLHETITTALGLGANTEGEFMARERHLTALREARTALAAIDPATLAGHPELVAEHYREASLALEAIGGRYTTEELLGDIFARFCIGK